MKLRLVWTGLVLAFAGAFALGLMAAEEPAKVAGKWEMTMQGPQGSVTRAMTIEQDGEKIKGVVEGPRGGPGNFEGTVKGSKLSFTVKRQGRDGNEITVQYNATVEGDSMKGTMEAGQFSREWTAKRQKELKEKQ